VGENISIILKDRLNDLLGLELKRLDYKKFGKGECD
jgi:hypothetical protein